MQPDQPNYWQHDHEKDPDIIGLDTDSDMYAPEDDEDLVENTDINDNPQKPEIKDEPIRWSASEYIHSEKDNLWFIVFGIVVVALVTSDILFLKSYTFSVLVLVMAIALVIYSRRKPQTINYTLSGNQGLYIGETLYHFSDFKSFGLIRDGEHHSIMLIPIKRFAQGVSVYFPEEAGEKIVDILGARLPMETLKLDLVDVLVRKLHL
jgi:hypothetical protein